MRKWKLEEYLKIGSDRALQIDAMHTRLHKMFGESVDSQAGNIAGILSPTDRAKYYNLKEKLSKIRVAHIHARAETIELHYFYLSAYDGLRELILDMVPPSTVLDFYSLRDRLVSLEVVNAGIPDMAKALVNNVNRSMLKDFMPMVLQRNSSHNEKRASISGPEFHEFKWNHLTLLRLRNCGICRMDASLHLFPTVTTVDLSHNQISNVVHLQDCHWLSELDLSYNRIAVLSNFSRVVGNLLVLNLSNNQITNLDGIEKLYALESLNLAYNEIDDENEVRLLTRLPCLDMIDLLGNPISEETSYREFFFLQFLVEGQIQQSGRDVPMLDNEPMTDWELRLLRSQLFRAADDQYKDLSHLDHDVEGNITRASLSDRESESISSNSRSRTNSALSTGRTRAGSSASQRLSALSDMSMRELAATLKGEGSFSLTIGSVNENGTQSSKDRESVQGGFRERSASGAKVRNLHGINNTKYALLSPTSFSGNDKKEQSDVSDSKENGAEKSRSVNTASTRGSPARKAKTKFESISTEGGDEMYVRKAKMGRRVQMTQPVVAEIVGGQPSPSSEEVDVKQMLKETSMRIAQLSDKSTNKKEFFVDFEDDEEGGYNFSPVKSVAPAVVIGTPADRGVNSESSSLANTPQIYSLHETLAEREHIMRDSAERITEETQETRESTGRRHASVASVGSSDGEFNIGSLGAPRGIAQRLEEKEVPPARGAPTGAQDERNVGDFGTTFEADRSRLISRDMPLDQRMRLLSVMSSDEGSSRHESVDSMSTGSHIAQLRSTLTLRQEAAMVRGTESMGERQSGSGLPSAEEVPSAFLASMAERAEREREERRKDKTPISSILGTLGMASMPVSSVGNTPSTTLSRSEDRLSTPPRGSSVGKDSEDSSSSRSSKALAAAATLTAKWAAKAAAASASSPGTPPTTSVDPDAAGKEHYGPSRSLVTSSRSTVATMHGNLSAPTLSSALQGDEAIDDFASSYAGNAEYRRLRVAENLELYLKEQVFISQRGKQEELYLAWGCGQRLEEDDLRVRRSVDSEVFLASFVEIVLPCGPGNTDNAQKSDNSSPGGSGKKKRDKKNSKNVHGDLDGASERSVLIVLSTEVLYYVDIDISPSVTFEEAPLLRVLRAHSLHALASCTVYFGFQRCMLEFSSAISPGEEGEAAYSFGDSPCHQYMVITREKNRTHPIITKVPKAANAARTATSGTNSLPGTENVQIYNRDSQLLDAVAEYAESKSQGKIKHDPDVANYQMVHQIWRKRPGASAPRSVVITSTLLLLCSENLHEQDVKLSVLDSSSVSDVSKLIAEDNDATCVTIVFKSASFGITQRKWRLRLKNTAAAAKFLQDIRKNVNVSV